VKRPRRGTAFGVAFRFAGGAQNRSATRTRLDIARDEHYSQPERALAARARMRPQAFAVMVHTAQDSVGWFCTWNRKSHSLDKVGSGSRHGTRRYGSLGAAWREKRGVDPPPCWTAVPGAALARTYSYGSRVDLTRAELTDRF